MRLLLIPAAGGVGLGPLTNVLSIAEQAAGAGHDVAFMVRDSWAPDIRRLGFRRIYPAPTPKPYQGVSPPPYNLAAVVTRLGWVDERYIRTSIQAERRAIVSFGADVVVTMLQFTAPISAALEGRPSVAITSWADGPGFASPLYEPRPYLKDAELPYNKVLQESGLPTVEHICELAFLRSDLKISPTIPELQPELLSMPDINFVGHLLSTHLETGSLPDDAETWEGTGPLVYVYLGPGDIPASKWLPTVAEAFEHTNFRVMVTLAQSRTSTHLPALRNVRFFDRLPGLTSVERCDVVISHGGANTVGNALLAGKPHLIFPDRYAERDYNGRAVERLGAGLNCPTSQFTPENLRLATERITADETFAKRAAEIGRRIHEYGGAQRAVELVSDAFA